MSNADPSLELAVAAASDGAPSGERVHPKRVSCARRAEYSNRRARPQMSVAHLHASLTHTRALTCPLECVITKQLVILLIFRSSLLRFGSRRRSPPARPVPSAVRLRRSTLNI